MTLPHRAGQARLAAVLAAVCVTTLGGCSDSGGSSSSSTAPSPSSSTGGHTVTIDNFTFKPATLTVSPGAEITVINKDAVTHTLTAVTGRAFNTGDIPSGKTVTLTAPANAGTYQYMCTIHPFMKGTLTVR
ncbi:cupredoxin domain-containing protein [Streptomyces sp. AK02-01A]|uniref:cupredoxin domain-containing protein n=1 Tax=Streptomyces sp. AK02-01A TaxID=3028648 RepID=UPI0029A0D9E2|nr:cupredoxin domain-containing protein [Streptomyces sp. AK02-01A]MDX3854552.1 cupredoxin domain-containing protein [Streptomyces sp. AK02-01A]